MRGFNTIFRERRDLRMSEQFYPGIKEALDKHTLWLKSPQSTGEGTRLNLSEMKLPGANFRRLGLHGAFFIKSDLRGAVFTGADLYNVDFTGADLSGADFSNANLRGANLSGANLSGARFGEATLTHALFRDANFSRVWLSDGIFWEDYLAQIVPALLTAGGKTLEEVSEGWDCYEWHNCPISIAFSATSLSGVPALYRRAAQQFIQFFDSKLIPNPCLKAVIPPPRSVDVELAETKEALRLALESLVEYHKANKARDAAAATLHPWDARRVLIRDTDKVTFVNGDVVLGSECRRVFYPIRSVRRYDPYTTSYKEVPE